MFLVDKYTILNNEHIFFHKLIYNNLIIGYNLDNYKYDLKKFNNLCLKKKYTKLINFDKTRNKIFDLSEGLKTSKS